MEAWLRARSLSRGLPQPVPDSGGLRVESGLPHETRRYLFARPVDGLREIAERIREPRIPLKLCDAPEILRDYLPPGWDVFPPNFVMLCRQEFCLSDRAPQPPEEYQLELNTEGAVTQVCVRSPDSELAASGYAAHHNDVFIYDRILTVENHRRKGLGAMVMTALASARPTTARVQILVATPAGRELYRSLGWSDYAPYASAAIPETPAR